MPIYEYQCLACGHEEEFIQKVSDAPLKKCPECGKKKLQKQVSASAFHLKGEGWYVTDFRDKGKSTPSEKKIETKAKPSTKAKKAKSGE